MYHELCFYQWVWSDGNLGSHKRPSLGPPKLFVGVSSTLWMMENTISSTVAAAPHILAIPFPLPGHITPLLRLCKLLASSGFSITFLNTPQNHSHLSKISSHYHHGQGRIRVVSMPDGLPLDSAPSWDGYRALVAVFGNPPPAFESLLEQLSSTGPPVVCVLSDAYLGWTQDVADKLGVPRVALWTSPAAECQVYLQVSRLLSTGDLPFKAPANRLSEDDVDNLIPGLPGKSPVYHQVSSQDPLNECIHIPGLPLLGRRDFPSFLQIEDCSDILFQFFINQTKRVPEANIVLVNSFLELEANIFSSLRATVNVLPVGPLFLLEENWLPSLEQYSSKKEPCIEWLDSQSANSVMYVAFGSMIPLPAAQVAALATGLEASQQTFIWAILPDPVTGQTASFPEGFLERTKGRGLVVDWAPQTLVLGHPSVGGFLSHCGWNSVLESISMGVPVIGCPLWADHPLICKLMVDEWGVAVRLEKTDEGLAVSKDVERLTREVIEGEKGRELRKRCGEWGGAAKRAVQSGGSSRTTLEAMVEEMKKKSQEMRHKANCNC